MKKNLLLTGLALSISLFGSSAFAASTLTVGSSTGGSVNFTFDGVSKSGTGGNFANSILDGQKLDYMYCIDLSHTISPGSTYNNVNLSNGLLADRPEITATNAGKIAWLMVNQAQTAITATAQAGLQAAIWEQIYGDRFTLTSTGSVKTAYDGFIAALGSNTASVNSVFWIDPRSGSNNTNSNQDQVGFRLATPVPAAIWLFGSGMVGLVRFSRRKNVTKLMAA